MRKPDFKKSHMRITFESIRISEISKCGHLSITFQIYKLILYPLSAGELTLHYAYSKNTELSAHAYLRTRYLSPPHTLIGEQA